MFHDLIGFIRKTVFVRAKKTNVHVVVKRADLTLARVFSLRPACERPL